MKDGYTWTVIISLRNLQLFVQKALSLSNSKYRWNLRRTLRLLIAGQMNWDQLASDCCTGRPVKKNATLIAKLVEFFSRRPCCLHASRKLRKYLVGTMEPTRYSLGAQSSWLHFAKLTLSAFFSGGVGIPQDPRKPSPMLRGPHLNSTSLIPVGSEDSILRHCPAR